MPNKGERLFVRVVLALDDTGRIETDMNMRTSLAGVFAADDIRRNSVAWLVAAAGDGATYLEAPRATADRT